MAVTVAVVVAATVVLGFAIDAKPAGAYSGGVTVDGHSGKPGKAKLGKNGKAIPPANAPKRVVKAIEAGNRIHRKPYRWGGGHGSFEDGGYDCSGAVSYVLHGAGMLSSPLASGGLMGWGRNGAGKWITVYAHGGHTYVVVAGLRFDTSDTGGTGPSWHKDMRSPSGFVARHFNARF